MKASVAKVLMNQSKAPYDALSSVKIDPLVVRCVLEAYIEEIPADRASIIQTMMKTARGLQTAERAVIDACTFSALTVSAPEEVLDAARERCQPASVWAKRMRLDIYSQSVADAASEEGALGPEVITRRVAQVVATLNA